MPPLPAIADVLKIQYFGTNEGQNWANVFHALYTGGPPGPVDCDGIAATAYEAYESNFLPVIQSNAHLQECKVTDLSSDLGAQGSYAEDNAGGLGSSSLTAQVALVISWRIGRRYRGGHPRTYLPPPQETDILDTSHWKPAMVARAATAAAGFMAAINAITGPGITTLSLGTVSYFDKATNPTPPHERSLPLFETINGANVHNRICTQRRRLGRGSL